MSHVPDIKIGRDICPQMANVTRSVGIRQPAGYQYGCIRHQYDFSRAGINNVMNMGKKLLFQTRSLGSEVEFPDLVTLAKWVSEQKPRAGDLMTFMLEQSLGPQIGAGIDIPCAGGMFYRDRVLESLRGIEEGVITGELEGDPSEVSDDAEGLTRKKGDLWFSIPAPHMLMLEDTYYGDDEEARRAIISEILRLVRSMRDRGIKGHVLLCDRMEYIELEMFAGRKFMFFQENPDASDLADLLEHHQSIAVKPEKLELVIDLMDEYTVKNIILVDPEDNALRAVLKHFDPEHIYAGGFCRSRCQEYWENVADSAVYALDSATDTK
jgi:hypothetical protein